MSPVRAPELFVTSKGEQRWKVRFRDYQGSKVTERSRSFTDQRGAREFARLLDQLGVEGALAVLDERVDAAEGTPTLTAYAHRHIDALTGVGEDYRRRSRAVVDHDLGALGALPVTAVTREGIARWVNDMAAAGASGKTIKNKHGLVSSVLAHAVRDGLIAANPCAGTRLPRTVTPAMTFLTPEEYARFLGCFTPRWQPMVALLFGTGLRFSEATALTVADVDLAAATITVTKAWKDNGRLLGAPKSRRSVRTVAIPPELVDALQPLVTGRASDELLLTNARGAKVRLQTFHDNVWQPAVRLANGEPAQSGKRVGRRRDADGRVIEPAATPLGKRPRVHDARHTCASWMLAAGVPINYVQAHLGHESITTTVDRYGHLMPAARAAVAGALSMAMTAAHPQIES